MSDLITVRQSKRYPDLYVKKYKSKVFYKNLWGEDGDLVESRGRVIDKHGVTVVNPFTKVFNFRERGTGVHLKNNPDAPVLAVEKVNGFMGAMTYYPEKNIVLTSTTGSLDSPFVDMANEYLRYVHDKILEEAIPRTHLFEIVHHNDPHIIEENFGAYYLGYRDVGDTSPYYSTLEKELEYDEIGKMFRCARPDYFETTFGEVVELNKKVKHEGFMIYGIDEHISMKLKSPFYLVSKAYARRKDIAKVNKQIIPEEFYDLVDYLEGIRDTFNECGEEERLSIIKEFLEKEHG